MTDVVSRRLFVAGLTALSVTPLIYRATAATVSGPLMSKEVSIENFSAAGVSEGIVRVAKIEKTDAEWRAQLTPQQYEILRKEGTERPGSSPLLKEHRKGTFACAGCDLPLFSSETKFESGTGWPSFWAPIKSAVNETTDRTLGMSRTAVSCHRCGGRLGHVFEDGPKPTGLRYCIDGAALNFKPTTT